ncbi:hypothetical protein [Methanoregula sp.]|uniref:hypothetical protein n=1 Tax=Methanoregula sp. TaxID=2052170 RepID=UPI002C406408|nr:hypothetical protein [Methanoregula sp.]HVP96748.1 hypothetical protein [Methanoregula sp.]
MADTSTQREVENWIRKYWLTLKFNQDFEQKKLTLVSGGRFEFDAVNKDDSIVINISTSSAKTSGGNLGSGKLQKIRADIYFLLLLPETVKRKLLVFTEPDMVNVCQNEKTKGRMPQNIEICLVDLPENIRTKLNGAKKIATKEMTSK